MQGISDLLQSERGVFAIMALVAATVLVVTGHLQAATWIDFVKYLAGVLIASKTVTTAVETVATRRAQNAPEAIPVAEVRPAGGLE